MKPLRNNCQLHTLIGEISIFAQTAYFNAQPIIPIVLEENDGIVHEKMTFQPQFQHNSCNVSFQKGGFLMLHGT
jgi:hypothetical protein